MARRSGRRPGESGTREAIREAACRQFGERGYDRASLRSIAAEAGVDPALVSYFFGSKQELFVAAMGLPVAPDLIVPAVFAAGREHAGERLAQFVVTLLEDPELRQRIVGLVRAAASEPAAAIMARDLFMREVVGRIAETLGAGDAELRANLVGSQLVGLVMARHVIGVEPLHSLPPDALAAALGPTLQRYLTGPLAPEG